jgi:DDE_Tnp_1-associated
MRSVNEDDMVSILEHCNELQDPRSKVNRRHLLGDPMVICVLSVVAGIDGPTAISVRDAKHGDKLIEHLEPSGPAGVRACRLRRNRRVRLSPRRLAVWLGSWARHESSAVPT